MTWKFHFSHKVFTDHRAKDEGSHDYHVIGHWCENDFMSYMTFEHVCHLTPYYMLELTT